MKHCLESGEMVGESRSQAAVVIGEEIDQMPKEPPVSVRFQREVKLALEKMAKSDDRTISYVINKIVVEYLRAKKLIK
jgi:hypothetical protein